MSDLDPALRNLILQSVPEEGGAIGNKKLIELLTGAADFDFAEEDYRRVRDALIAEGLLAPGRGRGGSVRRVAGASEDHGDEAGDFQLQTQKKPEPKAAPTGAPKAGKGNKRTAASTNGSRQVISYRYDERRKNNPHVGMVDTHSDGVEEERTWRYDPHLAPELQFDLGRDAIEKLIDDALASGDEAQMRSALEELKRLQSPYLNWTGKAERTSFEVDTVSLHVHERIDPATILAAVQNRIKNSKGKASPAFQPDMFHAPFENLPLRDAIDFYKHERDWSNRLIAGDSLLVMNSLLQKEGMAGQVQMIYIDPPYGIKYGSNFQPFVNKRDVKDRKDEDLTQEPEMIKAFRDTWELGIHSYLAYLRDRLLLARELLSESGSVFVQISDENLHHVREVMDEILGEENFCGQIAFAKTTGQSSKLLSETCDYLVWFCRDITAVKYRRLFIERQPIENPNERYVCVETSDGRIIDLSLKQKLGIEPMPSGRILRLDNLTSQTGSENSRFQVDFRASKYRPYANRGWSTSKEGITRLSNSDLLFSVGTSLLWKSYRDVFTFKPLTNDWRGLKPSGFGNQKVYVVQTTEEVVERCILMTTDPGDLVFDPTCGSGTTAFVAEKWGRRWITADTSRVAVTLAKQRLMTSSYNYYKLKYPQEGLRGGFIYKTVPHITLKSIANNPEIDEIYERMHPEIEQALTDLNTALKGQSITYKVTEGGRKGDAVDFSAPDSKTVDLPSGETVQVNVLLEWEVPFEYPEDWPQEESRLARKAFDAFHAARQAMQKAMDESNAAHAGQEVLYDQPEVSKDKLRITGPFTVEAVPFATVLGLEEAEQPREADVAVARSGATSRHALWREELLRAGIRGKGGQKLNLMDLETLPDAHYIHAVGTVADTGERVAVSFGPEHAALEQRQVEIAMREAGELFPLPKLLAFCAFTFDPEAAKDIDNIKGVQALKVQMNTDLLTEDLKKGRASNESFWLMGQPDVEVHTLKDGKLQVEVHGFDYFDTKTGELKSGGKKNIALWELDTDYDDRSLYPRQVFFPMAGKKDGWYKLKKDIRAELNEGLLEKFHGTKSLPFEPGENRCIAVKIVDDRGIESLKVIRLD